MSQHAAAPRRARGLTLVELLVSLAISLGVLSTLIYVFIGSRAAYRTNEALARVQESGRFALEWISRDLRSAGNLGCLSRTNEATPYSRPLPATWGNPLNAKIFGFENGAGFTAPTSLPRLRGDVVAFTSLAENAVAYVDDSDVVNANIKIYDNCPRFRANEIVLVTNCERAVQFTVTSVGNANNCPGGAVTTLTHAASGNGSNGVVSSHLINPPFTKEQRAFVVRFATMGYYVALNRGNRPALYRFSSIAAAEEIAENIEDIDFVYGLDTSGDGSVDEYRKADAISAVEWNNVLAVRVSLVAVSSETSAALNPQTYALRDTNGDGVVDPQTAADRRLRQVFTTTVALRNRLG